MSVSKKNIHEDLSIAYEKLSNEPAQENNQVPVAAPTSCCQAIQDSLSLGSKIAFNLLIGTAGVYVNTVMLSHLDKENKNLAASNLMNTYQNLAIASPNAILFSISSSVTRTNNPEIIKTIFRNGALLASAITLPCTILVLVSGPVLRLFQQPQDLTEISEKYFQGFSWGVPALFLLSVEQQVALGRNKASAVNLICLLNAGLTAGLGYAMMYGKFYLPKLEAQGLGHASSLANWLSLIGFSGYLAFSKDFQECDLISRNLFKGPYFDRNLFNRLKKIGTPIGTQVGIEFLSLIATTAIIGSLLSDDALKSNEIALQYLFASIVPIYGLGQACSILTGMAGQRRDLNYTKKLTYASLGIGTAFSLGIIILNATIPNALMSPFINVDSPENQSIVSTTRYLLLTNAISQLFDTIRIISGGAIQGTFDNTSFAMKTAFLTMCLLAVPSGYVLAVPMGVGALGIYIARGIGLTIGSTAVFSQWYKRLKTAILAPSDPNEIPATTSFLSSDVLPSDSSSVVVAVNSNKQHKKNDEPVLNGNNSGKPILTQQQDYQTNTENKENKIDGNNSKKKPKKYGCGIM